MKLETDKHVLCDGSCIDRFDVAHFIENVHRHSSSI